MKRIVYQIDAFTKKMFCGNPAGVVTNAEGMSEFQMFNSDDLDHRCPIQTASTGHSKVMVGIKSKERLDSLCPKMDRLKSISSEIGCNGFYVFTFDSGETGVLVSGRMFAPAIGINEDPVTGNANGPLGAYLVLNRLVEAQRNKFEFVGKQGEAIGRKGYVGVKVEVDDTGIPQKVVISGDAVAVFRTEIEI